MTVPPTSAVPPRRRLLMLLQLPPPLHGHSFMNQLAVQALEGCADLEVRVVPLQFNADMTRIGRFSPAKILVLLRTAARLVWQLVSWRPERVYFTPCARGRWALARDAALIAVVRFFRVPFLHHLHGLGVRSGIRRRPWMRRLFRFMFRGSEVICLGRIQAGDLEGAFDGTPFVLPNGIPDEPSPDRGEGGDAGAGGRPVRILYLSHLMTAKGVLDFVDLLARLRERGVAFTADIAGSDGDVTRGDLERRLDGLGLEDRVRLPGQVVGGAKLALFSAADLLVFPSRFEESFGLVAVEAMRAGIPVVTSSVGGLPEIVGDGVTGRLVPPGDVEGFAGAVEALAADPALRRRLGAAGRARFLERYTAAHFQQGLCSVVRSVLGAASRAPAGAGDR